ncbi:MAG: NUDIX hydrolase [Arenibacterium sp.]
MQFAGAKLALFLGDDLLVIRRDDTPGLPWPNYWDLPGGGREGSETPEICALRETEEEVGLVLSQKELVWSRKYERPHGQVWFFAAHRPASDCEAVRFGGEGQGWELMSPETYCAHPLAVPHFAERVTEYLRARDRNRSLPDSDVA